MKTRPQDIEKAISERVSACISSEFNEHDDEIEIGVRNGYPPETQLAIYKSVVAMLVKPNVKLCEEGGT